ncbi:hypothetical protein D3C87_1922550 [compost metagenome]
MAESLDDLVDGLGDFRQNLFDGLRDLVVFAIHGRENFAGRHEIDLDRIGIAGLGIQRFQLRHQSAFCHG